MVISASKVENEHLKEELTMDTSNSDQTKEKSVLNVKVYDLMNSPDSEDHKIAGTCMRVIEEIMEKIKPILRYICTQMDFYNLSLVRCLEIGNFDVHEKKYTLFLTEDKNFFVACKIGGGDDKLRIVDMRMVMQGMGHECNHPEDIVMQGDIIWIHMPFSELIANLKTALDRAQQKRQEHLDNLKKRSDLLDKILETIKTA